MLIVDIDVDIIISNRHWSCCKHEKRHKKRKGKEIVKKQDIGHWTLVKRKKGIQVDGVGGESFQNVNKKQRKKTFPFVQKSFHSSKEYHLRIIV